MKRIWLIDDDQDDKEVFELALGKLDVETQLSYAANGEHALQAANDPAFLRPDYIFLDMNMPRINGLEFLTKLRNGRLFEGVPVFIYSTSSVGPDIDKCLSLGGILLTKHSSFTALCEELERRLI